MKEFNRRRLLKYLMVAVVIFICFIFYFSVWYMKRYFPNWHMKTVLYAFNGPYHHMFIKKYLKQVVLSALGICFLLLASFVIINKDAKKRHYHYQVKLLIILVVLMSMVTSVHASVKYSQKINLNTYLNRQLHPSSWVEDHYVDPASTKLTFPKKKRNVIYVYMESMEQSYMNAKVGGQHHVNLIPELTKLAQNNENFSNSKSYVNGAHALTGTTWTIGGIVAATSGLYLSPQYNNNEYNNSDVFYPKVTAFGDILHKQGYKQVFLLGSDAYFGGRDRYLLSHGHYEIEDYLYAKKHHMISSQYKKWWGYEDEKLFKFAKKKLSKLGKSSQPFNFSMLTADTHITGGYRCRLCRHEHKKRYEDVISCSSRQVSKFIKWCQKQKWYKNTTIILSGDHPSMSSTIQKGTPWSKRLVYTCYINSAVKRANNKRRVYSTEDNFPTSLAAMGVKIQGDRLGLGTNLYSNKLTYTEKYGFEQMRMNQTMRSPWLEKQMETKRFHRIDVQHALGVIPQVEISLKDVKMSDKYCYVKIHSIKVPKNFSLSQLEINAGYRADGAYGNTVIIHTDQIGKDIRIRIDDKTIKKNAKRKHVKTFYANVYVRDEKGLTYKVGSATSRYIW